MSYNLKYCVWELTLKCNLHCEHCGSRAGLTRSNELTLDECYQVAEQLKELECKNVCLIGGEVLLRKDWYNIANRLISYGIHTNIITNGFMFGKNELEQIKKSGIESVCVSIDGCEEVHNKIRGKNCFINSINTINILKSNGYRVSVLTTLNSFNIGDMDVLYGILIRNKVDLWQLQLCAPFGNARAKSEMMVTSEQLKRVMNFIVKKRNEGIMQIGAAHNIGYFTEEEPHLRGPLNEISFFTGCSAGINTIGIDSAGNVRGCESLYDDYFIEGNLRDCKLKELWNDDKAFEYNRAFKSSLLTGKCKLCEKGRICAGGCRSMNYFGHAKLYESYLCIKQTSGV